MTTSADELAPPPVPDQKANPFQRIVGVLFAPTETFESIARRPDFLVPLIIVLICSAVAGVVMAQKVDFGAPAREAMAARDEPLPEEQLERAVKMSAAVGKAISYASPLLAIIFLILFAAVLLFSFRLMGGEGGFKQAFSVVTYASMITNIEGIIRIIILATKEEISATEIPTLVLSNPGFLVDPKEQAMAFALLSSIDVFTIWYVVLLILGFAAISRLSRGRSAAIVISLWVVVIVFKLGMAALQSMRG